MDLLQTVVISVVCSIASVFAYDQFLANKPTLVAVANYDMALSEIDDPNDALAALRSNSSILAAEGYVVIDSRALLGYPSEVEIPREALESVIPKQKGNQVPLDAGDALEGGDE
ncbi:hypothetical protein [Metapseudomonas otitidis]|uniref:hypothetical protein n=1 Tax=Metapseudomonas otitidis TaxID=319939 RepID=UPI0013F5D3D1|nr:hypothetical protein [Pseudomonas otitidis]